MKIEMQPAILFLAAALAFSGCLAGCGNATTATMPPPVPPSNLIASLQPYPTPTGTVSTYTSTGSIDPNGIFFQPLGTNARSCASCHQLSQGMSISTASAQALFTSSNGTDPLFLAVDGANCPTAQTGDSAGHSLLLNNGLIRIAEGPPATAQFQIAVVQDPYGCAVSTNSSTGQQIYSVYRRPLPASGLTFLSDVMWDTRETVSPLNTAATFNANLNSDLSAQAANAVVTHEQGGAPLTGCTAGSIGPLRTGPVHCGGHRHSSGIANADVGKRRSSGPCNASLLSGHRRCFRPGSAWRRIQSVGVYTFCGLGEQPECGAGEHCPRRGCFQLRAHVDH